MWRSPDDESLASRSIEGGERRRARGKWAEPRTFGSQENIIELIEMEYDYDDQEAPPQKRQNRKLIHKGVRVTRDLT
ncbi:hypothetical protein WR25_13924 [Diploscapter pachys]|uniref:Uncharacterized protein n=1 Tax=Diploscapter pachys TaxID=2018661 RepID=A0A2A2K4U3_9BILA|nr:hypothetical protein WR25_13924 [Diploscapter pachys]